MIKQKFKMRVCKKATCDKTKT